jgi:delta 1-pyrroline-5-carboxylate dehydrogenase
VPIALSVDTPHRQMGVHPTSPAATSSNRLCSSTSIPSARWRKTKCSVPVLTVTSFDTEEHAVDIANATRYGLGAFVQTRDIARAHRIVPLLHAGTVSVNGTSGLPPGAPFGGYNHSGYGREGGREKLFEFLRTKKSSSASKSIATGKAFNRLRPETAGVNLSVWPRVRRIHV